MLRPEPWESDTSKVIAYLENAQLEFLPKEGETAPRLVQRQTSKSYVGRFYSNSGIRLGDVQFRERNARQDALYQRALQARDHGSSPDAQPAQFNAPLPPPATGGTPAAPFSPMIEEIPNPESACHQMWNKFISN